MSAPILWIAVPFVLGVLILFVLSERYAAYVGGTISTILAAIAFLIPIDTALLLGNVSLKISPAIEFFGRSFELSTADGRLLTLIYGLAALWFFGTEASGTAHRFVSLGLMITALLTASIAVEPFLYAALLLEMAAMLVVPLLVPLYQRPGRGVTRFIIYQTLAMPFILFSGWMLAGVEASPGDLGTIVQSGVMVTMGFAFLFAVFPLYNWIPQLIEETNPYAVGFLLWALPTFTTIFALGFLDRYTWLRNTPQISNAILFSGVIMTATGGIFGALQRHLGRIFGYAAIAETGLLLIALGLRSSEVVNIAFLILIPRGLELSVWALALSIIKRKAYPLKFSDVQGLARKYPVATSALIIAHLSVAGFPLLAGFPSRLALWQELSLQSLSASLWVFLGLLGLLVASVRTLATLVMASDDAPWELNETWVQTFMLGIGVLGIFLLGLFPQILQPFLSSLPALFEHLIQ
ncbi:MAG TPA: proton-conducting transporter membrane subunit [Anaerolineales bacterium]|nr:proton-conducting transporter membrane subunit [Anaerolineales bacterium]HNH25855.1 proton-conducting transporter membrane subunit [Anaerolineales bacterium]